MKTGSEFEINEYIQTENSEKYSQNSEKIQKQRKRIQNYKLDYRVNPCDIQFKVEK